MMIAELLDKSNQVAISFRYDPNLVSVMRMLSNRKFDPVTKRWLIPYELSNLLELHQKLSKKGITCDNLDVLIKNLQKESDIELNLTGLKRTPYPHQIEAAKFLLVKKKAICGDEMVVGKSLSAIVAALQVPGRKIIVCPATLKLNWRKELICAGVGEDDIFVVKTGKDIIPNKEYSIINYDLLDPSKINFKFNVLIVDEAQYIKGLTGTGKPGTKRAKAVLALAERAEYVWLLTGTPITSRTKDIINLLRAIKSPIVENFYRFAYRYCGAYKHDFGFSFDGATNTEELNKRLQGCMIRRLKSEILTLPEKIRTFLPVEIDLKRYNKAMYEYSKGKTITEKIAEIAILKHILAVEKVKYTIELVGDFLENDQQVVVFTNYKDVVSQIITKYDAAVITGEQNAAERQKAVEDFQSGKKKLIVCNLVAGGTGLTLTASNTVIVNDMDWTPGNHIQAEDRVHRIGQKQNCNIYYIYAQNAEIDVMLADMLEEKLSNIATIVDGTTNEEFIQQVINYLDKITEKTKAKTPA